jgi:hypothetical protein
MKSGLLGLFCFAGMACAQTPATNPAPSSASQPSLVDAIKTGDMATTDSLIAHGADLNATGQDGETPLTEAILSAGGPGTISELLEKGADANRTNARDETPLMIVVTRDKFDPSPAQLLLDHGAKVDARNKAGATALIYASKTQNGDGMGFLLGHGADINAKDNMGGTALDYGEDRGWSECVAWLTNQGAASSPPHIVPKPVPNPPLSPAQAYGLALGAMYFQVNGENPHILGGATTERPQEVRDSLAKWWDITDRASFLQGLSDLRSNGWGVEYCQQGAKLSKLSDASLALTSSGDDLESNKRMRDCYNKWGNRTGVAWDLCRYVNLVSNGYTCGYITADEAWADIMPAARDAQKAFSSWKEMGDSFYDARLIWNHGPDAQFETCMKLLLNPKDPNSVWTQIPWQTHLGS